MSDETIITARERPELSDIVPELYDHSVRCFAITDADRERALADNKGNEDGEVRTVTFTAASSTPLIRHTMWGFIKEWTDFKGLDDARLNSKTMPLLDSHNSGRLKDIVGKIVSHRTVKRVVEGVEEDALEVTAEFNMSIPESKAAYEKVRTGLAANISIGYDALGPSGVEAEWYDEKKDWDHRKDLVGEVVYRKWEIHEVSIVPVPADNFIGIGRSATRKLEACANLSKTRKGSTAMTEQTQTEAPAERAASVPTAKEIAEELLNTQLDAEAAEERAPETEVEEIDNSALRYLAKQGSTLRGQGVTQAQLDALAEEAGEGMSEAEVKSKLFELLQERDTVASPVARGKAPAAHVSGKDHQKFDFQRLGKMLLKEKEVDGREGDLIAEHLDGWTKEKLPEVASPHSIFIPFRAFAENDQTRKDVTRMHGNEKRLFYTEAETRAYAVGNSPSGMFHQVFDELWFSEALLAQAETLKHVTMLTPEQTQNLVGVTETGSVSTSFVANETATRAESTGPSFGNKNLTWKMIVADVDISLRSMDQSNYFSDRILSAMRRDIMRGVNNSVISGSGSNGQPQGINEFPSIDVVEIGTNGGHPTYGHMVELRSVIEANNADAQRGRYLMTPEIKARLQQTPRFTSSTGAASDRIISSPMLGQEVSIDGFPVTTENNLPKNLTKGSLNSAAHLVVFGVLPEIELGSFSGVELLIDPYTSARTSQVRFMIRYAFDFIPRHVASFAVIRDAQK